jgi:uncharacterized Zn-finger protein
MSTEEDVQEYLDKNVPIFFIKKGRNFFNYLVRVYECNVCSKKFKYKSNLNTHLLIHVGRKSYVCEVCGKAFRTLGSHKSHISIHSEQKKYKCDKCPNQYYNYSRLRVHLRTHVR